MGLVASSKIRRANDAMEKSREYAASLKEIIDFLSASDECRKSPYMQEHEESRTRLIVIAGDRGLAGGYNANIFRLLRSYPDAQIIPIGKRVCDRVGEKFVSSETFSVEDAGKLARKLCEDYKNKEFDRLGIVCTRYVSMMTQQAEVRWVLPVVSVEGDSKNGTVIEPDELSVFDTAVLQYVSGAIYAAVRESFLSEVAARRMAMDSAGKNAQEMIDDLQLQYNRARQGSITQEITEIVAGSNS